MSRARAPRLWLLLPLMAAVAIFAGYALVRPEPAVGRGGPGHTPQRDIEAAARPESPVRPRADFAIATELDLAPPAVPVRAAPGSQATVEPFASDEVPLARRMSALISQAESGNAEAARMLGRDLYRCHRYFRELQRVGRTTASRSNVDPAMQAAALTAADRFLKESQAQSEACDGVTREQTAQWPRWLEHAASAGDDAAAHLLAQVGMEPERQQALVRDPEELIRFRNSVLDSLGASARRCHAPSIGALSRSYQYGTYSRVEPVMAYGLGVAAAWAEGSDPSSGQFRVALRRSLTQEQFSQAVDFARRYFDHHCR